MFTWQARWNVFPNSVGFISSINLGKKNKVFVIMRILLKKKTCKVMDQPSAYHIQSGPIRCFNAS